MTDHVDPPTEVRIDADDPFALAHVVCVMPLVVLRTRRTVIRPFRVTDAADVAEGVDEEVLRWIPLPQPYDESAALTWCAEQSHHVRLSGEGQSWAVCDPETDRFLATLGLTRTRWEHRVTEVGYWAAPHARGRGFVAEAARTVSEWALREVDFARVELRAAVGNTASQRVAEKAGFTREGVLRNADRHRGRQHDLVSWSLVPADLD
ncbi:GNAT family N-acetyltransferase [Allokutzneria oryzae]|uniref:GNAT family N-acetyltransferase n=1 Tax=Allokutzneria oryzae TaxID=1378989 RepID=A0ABV6A4Y3_9PSEU